jgi:polyisoprenoid-binding protein YceI
MRRSLFVLAAVLAAGCVSIEEHAAPAAAAPAAAPAATPVLPFGEGVSRVASEQPSGAYALDSRHMAVIWKVRHLGIGVFPARFDVVSGTLNFNAANPAASTLNVTIAANSVNTGVLNREGARAFDQEIHTQVFDSANHPQITFVSRSIAVTGPNTGTIVGDLTLRGVTKPVTIDATFEAGRFVAFRGKHVLAFTGRTTINRKDFGASLSNPLADGAASDIVAIDIAAEFIQQ